MLSCLQFCLIIDVSSFSEVPIVRFVNIHFLVVLNYFGVYRENLDFPQGETAKIGHSKAINDFQVQFYLK